MKYKILILISIVILSLGLLFRTENLIINIGDTYYVASYLTLSIYMLYISGLTLMLFLIKDLRYKKLK